MQLLGFLVFMLILRRFVVVYGLTASLPFGLRIFDQKVGKFTQPSLRRFRLLFPL